MGRVSRRYRPWVEALERRVLLSAGVASARAPVMDPGVGTFPAADATPGSGGAAFADPGSVTHPLTSVPILNSLPGAAVALYLDFDGFTEASWSGYHPGTTPAFDQDGDATTFTDAELTAITQIWRYVAEDYAPFNLNVTTVEPADISNGVAVRAVIGGRGGWTLGSYGGIAFVDSFTSSLPNSVYVFPKNLGNGNPKFVGDAVSHESGHSFGLEHQSKYVNGVKVNEYYSGTGDGRAPLMGNSYDAARGLWWRGTSVSATTIQDDLEVISRPLNGFGYRPDDHGDSADAATPLTASGGTATAAGVITSTGDADFFSFTTGAEELTLAVTVPANVNNLDATLSLRDANGVVLASADPSGTFGAAITLSVNAGTYYAVVGSHGNYDDLGQYTVSATVVDPPASLDRPTDLAVSAAAADHVDLTWTDHATGESGYQVERSTDGIAWAVVTTLAADSAAYTDAAAPGTTYSYRVRAVAGAARSAASDVETVTTVPASPADLTARVVSSTRVDLSWDDVQGETEYRIERSADGAPWEVAGVVTADVTTAPVTGLDPSTRYLFRVVAHNTGGDSAPSDEAQAVTASASTVPAVPSRLTARLVGGANVLLTWRDNAADEDGYRLIRSTNGGRTWSFLADVGADVTSYTDTDIVPFRTYAYRVSAFNSGGESRHGVGATVSTGALKGRSSHAPLSSDLGRIFARLFRVS